jgi:hypothetical protein
MPETKSGLEQEVLYFCPFLSANPDPETGVMCCGKKCAAYDEWIQDPAWGWNNQEAYWRCTALKKLWEPMRPVKESDNHINLVLTNTERDDNNVQQTDT